jgi:hypothetical protein
MSLALDTIGHFKCSIVLTGIRHRDRGRRQEWQEARKNGAFKEIITNIFLIVIFIAAGFLS